MASGNKINILDEKEAVDCSQNVPSQPDQVREQNYVLQRISETDIQVRFIH